MTIKRPRAALIATAVLITLHSLRSASAGLIAPDPAAIEMLHLGLRGVHFVPNHGQWADQEVQFGLRSRGVDVAFRESSFTMHLARRTAVPGSDHQGAESDDDSDARLSEEYDSSRNVAALEHLTLTVTFPGSNPVLPQAASPQSARFNYFVGGRGRSAASNVPSFAELVYPNLYDGVDLHVMGNGDGILKYEFHVAPGADYSKIRVAYDGIESLCIDDSGNLCIGTIFGILMDHSPIVWQGIDGGRRDIAAHFEMVDIHTSRIAIEAAADPSQELIIDPDVEWMIYLGGSGSDVGNDVFVDSSGDILLTGNTNSTDFDGRNNSYHGGVPYGGDGFVCKISAAGVLQWMTYLGGSDADSCWGVAVDSALTVFVAGTTYSDDVEGRNNVYHGDEDAFVAKVSSDGVLLWVTYLGGHTIDVGTGIAVNSADELILCGWTVSNDFEGRGNSFHGSGHADAYVSKVAAGGGVVWMTYLGGTGDDFGSAVRMSDSDHAVVVGGTNSIDFEGRSNALHGSGNGDAFLCDVSDSGSLQWMTYVGGSGGDRADGLAVSGSQDLFLVGSTDSTDFDARTNNYHGGGTYGGDAFVCRLNAGGVLQWTTYLGGSDTDNGYAISLDSNEHILITGNAVSMDFEGRENTNHGGNVYGDAFVGSLTSDGSTQWMDYLGGSNDEYGFGIAINNADEPLVAGTTASLDFEGRSNRFYFGGNDAFLVKVSLTSSPSLTITSSCPSGGPIQVSWSGATGGGTIALLYARTTGSFVIPNNHPCAGTALGLSSNQLQIGYQGGAGANGSRTVNSNTGPGACGGYMQLLDVPTCGTSNVVRVE